MLVVESKQWNYVPPKIYRSFINIKNEYAWLYYLENKLGMARMLTHAGLPLVGRHHSGLDDCRNTANILIHVVNQGHQLVKIEKIDSNRYKGKGKPQQKSK